MKNNHSMIMTGKNRKKWIAAFFLALLVIQDFYPVTAYALTSGPTQPEMAKFQPAGANNLVDLFSGDFKYDIPLMDVGGYPINLSYHSGTNIEDEASWVGVGWTLNPGAVNRTMRGLPDDFTGDNNPAAGDLQDVIKSVQHRKDFVKIGGQISLKGTLFGWNVGSGSLHLGVYKDNYYGIGADLGAGVSFALDQNSTTSLTAGLNLNSDTRTGVTLSPSMTLSDCYDGQKEMNNASLTGGFSYNTRSGLESVNLSQSFGLNGSVYADDYGTDRHDLGFGFGFASFDKSFAHTYTPSFSYNMQNSSTTFNFDLGPSIFGGYVGIGGSGYKYTQTNVEPHSTVPAYGYLHYAAGTKNPAALLDFNREKDGPFLTTAPAIPVPVSTEDYFEVTSQVGAQQFRPYYNGNYIVYDRPFSNNSNSAEGGVTFGAGNLVQTGAQLNLSNGQSVTQEWKANNGYLNVVPSPHTIAGKYTFEDVYFKAAGEMTKTDPCWYNDILQDKTVQVYVNSTAASGSSSKNYFKSSAGNTLIPNPIMRKERDIRTSAFSYLTAQQASTYGLDKTIYGAPRVDVNHKAHHISEITVTDKEGKRMVYGIPVYNLDKEEVSFSANGPDPVADPATFSADRQTGLVRYKGNDNTESNGNGRENIFNRKSIPPYATSWLLTGILSPDYVDVKHDGITDDDLGSAILFHYAQKSNYNWRAPFDAGMANYNEGFLSDQTDDKGSYEYGTRETWYLDTISSKTMLAQFYTSPRQDAMGVIDENGGMNTGSQLWKLDSIRLFSKADLIKNGANAVPIKVAHFVYDYSLYPGVLNNVNPGQGKLTLKEVYFTFGTSSRGQTNPYLFSYDMRLIRDGSIANLPSSPTQNPLEATDQFTQRQSDRWGTYKQSYFNHLMGGSVNSLNNSEFPYSIQPTDNGAYDERMLADRLCSKWQLNSITTPTGGTISVEYESDDYAYVQDRKAMMMCSLAGVGAVGQNTGLIGTNMLYVTVPVAYSSVADFINTYLSAPPETKLPSPLDPNIASILTGQVYNNISFKIRTQVDNNSLHSEYVNGYAEIDYSSLSQFKMVDNHNFGIPVKMVNGYNPVSVATWQMIQDDLPQYAYPNYDNSNVSGLGGDATAAIRSIVQAFVNLRELFESYDQIASGSKFANNVDLSRSLIRLNCPVGKANGESSAVKKTYGKLGGGSRVHKVEIKDNWNTMVPGTKPVAYGVLYDYTTTDDQGNTISSGVASYEPGIGNEENPFHQPIDYTEKIEWGSSRYHYMETPFGESYFPSPGVGYSQVKATPYGADYTNSQAPVPYYNTGYTLSQFYTARDFPTQVDYMPLEEDNFENDVTILLFGSRYTNKVTTSQGFKVITNDMHGKSKSTQIFDKAGTLVSSVENFYNVVDPNAERKQLNNTVMAMDTDGSIPGSGMLIATDADLVTDLRESKSTSAGASMSAYGGAFAAVIFVVPFAGFSYSGTASDRVYNSASTVKVIRQYGILQEVKTTQNGSTLTADNLLWDAKTGQVLLTRNQNEFNDYTYALQFPAYRAYDGMGGAYQNIGALLSGFQTDANGTPGASFLPYVTPGDELVDIDAGSTTRGWIMQSGDGSIRFIDQYGNFITGTGNYLIVRSGRRNMLGAGTGSVVTMSNPMVPGGLGYILQAGVSQRVLDAKAVTYKDEWGAPTPNFLQAASSGSFPVTPGIKPPTAFLICQTNDENNQCENDQFGAYVTVTTSQQGAAAAASTASPLVSTPGTTQAIPTRGFASFGIPWPLSTLPAGAAISSVTLSLTAITGNNTVNGANATSSGNAAYIQRATQSFLGCAGSWASQPQSTTTNEVALATSTTTNQNYPSVDVTAMFNDWLNYNAANPQSPITFGVVCLLQDETTVTNRSMLFQGALATSPPVLTINYTVPGQCASPIGQVINPYFQGVKGNWRPNYNYAYQVNRVQVPGNPNQAGGTNIRSSGYYNMFTPFWTNAVNTVDKTSQGTLVPISPVGTTGAVADSRWIFSNKSIYFDQKGNEVESMDALKRYSAALFGYQSSLAVAVATNARHNEIAFDGFEDYYFNVENIAPAVCPTQRQLDLGFTLQGNQYCSGGNCIVSGTAHTGNYSLNLSGSINVTKPWGSSSDPTGFLGFDQAGHGILLNNELAQGFAPVNTKSYVLSMWVNDGSPGTNLINGLQVSVNGSSINLSNLQVPVVEGWKQLTVTIPPPASSVPNFSLQLTGGANIYIDDLRILPFDGEMKTFVYDDQSLRLMGQLDENNFGLIYEYDDEGTLIRVKKETERGIMTVKENRQSMISH